MVLPGCTAPAKSRLTMKDRRRSCSCAFLLYLGVGAQTPCRHRASQISVARDSPPYGISGRPSIRQTMTAMRGEYCVSTTRADHAHRAACPGHAAYLAASISGPILVVARATNNGRMLISTVRRSATPASPDGSPQAICSRCPSSRHGSSILGFRSGRAVEDERRPAAEDVVAHRPVQHPRLLPLGGPAGVLAQHTATEIRQVRRLLC